MAHRALTAAIIDLDGTLVDTMGDFCEALARMLADLGRPAIARADVERMVGKGSEHLIRSALVLASNSPIVGMNRSSFAINLEAIYPLAWASYQRHYAAINGQFSAVYPGAVEGLQALQAAGLKLACVTNKPLAFAQQLLKAKGLDGYFSVVFGGDSFERKKPDPLPLLKTCEALGSLPAQTLMVGDSSNDALAARAALCPVVLVTYGYNHGEPIYGVDADGFVGSLADLIS